MKRIVKTEHGVMIELTRGQWALIDEEDMALVAQYSWNAGKRSTGTGYYAMTRTPTGGTIYMHRLIAQPPDGKEVDHENGNSLDNRRKNLRHGTRMLNMQNRRGANTNSTTGIRGVYIHRVVKADRKKATSKTVLFSYNARYMLNGKAYTKNFPYTPDGLQRATTWVETQRKFHMEFA